MNPSKPIVIRPDILERVLSLGIPKTYERGQLFTDTQQSLNPLLFIRKGIVRSFYRIEDAKITNAISSEGTFSCTESFFSGLLGHTMIEVLEALEVIEIKRENLYMAYQSDPSIEQFGRLLAEYHLSVLERNYLIISVKSARDRYMLFLKLYPTLINRIPLKYVASFLHLDQATLSRVRGEKKNYAAVSTF